MNYFLTYTVYVLILSLLMGISTWKLFKKMGYNPLVAFVPFYNYFIILKETKNPKWWVVLAYLPIVGPIMMTVFHILLMKKFGKKLIQHQVLTALLPFIYMAAVNYGKDTELEDETEYFYANTTDEPKEKKKDTLVGSLTFAIVFATIIHHFIAQPFGIPTGSMERTMLVGDFLFVNKMNYGLRLPMRPLSIPFLQGTIMDTGQKGNPKDDPKSYVEAVKLPYFRLPGWEKVKRNDIVVFNYPEDSVHTAIDRKDPYVKRCVAVGGDTFEMRAGRMYINGKPERRLADAQVQHAYFVETSEQLDIAALYQAYGFLPLQEGQTEKGFVYRFQGLTDEIAKDIKTLPEVLSLQEELAPQGEGIISYYPIKRHGELVGDEFGRAMFSKKIDSTNSIFPFGKPWNPDWYGPLKVPKKGETITLTPENIETYRRIITQFEGNKLETKNGQFYINGKPTNQYKIQQEYYMMIGDNRDASLDARFFGFVPETHIMGKPMFTWMSVEGLFADANSTYQPAGKRIRWDRMFKATNTGEAQKTSYWWIAAIILILFFGWEYFVKLFKRKKKED